MEVYMKHLIPKDKFDTSNIFRLLASEEHDLKQILPELIRLIADFNWPIAPEMIPVLVKYPDSIVPVIKDVLSPSEKDGILKYWVIIKLVPELPINAQVMLEKEIERIVINPTENELCEGVDEKAAIYLVKFKKCNIESGLM